MRKRCFYEWTMQALFDHVSDTLVLDPYSSCRGALAEDMESALLDTLTDRQKALWDQWYAAWMEYMLLYEQALFQAAFALARELG